VTLHEQAERCRVRELSVLGLLHRALELRHGQNAGEVEKRAGDGGDGDAVLLGDLVRGKLGVMKRQAPARAQGARRGHVHASALRRRKTAGGRGRRVAQRRGLASGQDARHPVPLGGQVAVADGVDDAQGTPLDAVVDRGRAGSDGE